MASANSGEGRSTTVCNLGLALAEAGTRVLIIDADLRGPAIARCLGVDGTIGLTDVLVNRASVEQALRPIGPALDVLPSGWIPPNPSELLGSNRTVNLIATLRRAYDVVLIDTAPLLPVTDAAVLAPRADGVLLLVHHGRTHVQDVQTAKDALHTVSGRILGSVMTMVPHTGNRAHARIGIRMGRLQRRPPQPLVPSRPSRQSEDGQVAAPAAVLAPVPVQGGFAVREGSTVPVPPQKAARRATHGSGPRPSEPPPDGNGQVLDGGGPGE